MRPLLQSSGGFPYYTELYIQRSISWNSLFLLSTGKRNLPTFVFGMLSGQTALIELRNIDWRDIFLGLPGNSNRIKCINTLIILLKFTIFNSRTGSNLPSLVKIKKSIRNHKEVKTSIKVGKLGLHFTKVGRIGYLDIEHFVATFMGRDGPNWTLAMFMRSRLVFVSTKSFSSPMYPLGLLVLT